MIHIHNGDSVLITARRSNIPGRHIAFRESLIAGPVAAATPPHEWIEQRARFLADSYDAPALRVRTELLEQEQAIDDARHEDEIVLWFEHDVYCLVHLIYLLNRLAKARHLSTVWSSQPLGAMDEEELINAFNSRAAVTPSMQRLAAEAWNAYAADDPTGLNRLIAAESPDFPFLRAGLTLHASRYPSTINGLGEVERRALEGIAAGASDFNSLFARFDESAPRFGFGDGEFLRHLRRLATVAVPMITINEVEGEVPPKALFALTPAGENVVAGKADFIDLNNAGFWLGGVYLTRERLWRWDAARREIVWSGAVH